MTQNDRDDGGGNPTFTGLMVAVILTVLVVFAVLCGAGVCWVIWGS